MTPTDPRGMLVERLNRAAPAGHPHAAAWVEQMTDVALAPAGVTTPRDRKERLDGYARACDAFLDALRPLDGFAFRRGVSPAGDFYEVQHDADSALAIWRQGFERGAIEQGFDEAQRLLDAVRSLRLSIAEALDQPDARPPKGGRGPALEKKRLAWIFASSWSAHFGQQLPPTGETSPAVEALAACFVAAELDSDGARDQLRDARRQLEGLRT